jgi:neutral trehalase
MNLTQYKKTIRSLSRDELEAHLFEMFKSSKTFKDIESSYWSKESNEELVAGLQKRLDKVFWKNHFSMGECKGVLSDYLGRTVD